MLGYSTALRASAWFAGFQDGSRNFRIRAPDFRMGFRDFSGGFWISARVSRFSDAPAAGSASSAQFQGRVSEFQAEFPEVRACPTDLRHVRWISGMVSKFQGWFPSFRDGFQVSGTVSKFQERRSGTLRRRTGG